MHEPDLGAFQRTCSLGWEQFQGALSRQGTEPLSFTDFCGSLVGKWFCPTLNQSCFTCSWLESSFRSWAVSRLSLSTLTPANEPMCSIDAEPAEFLLRAWLLPLPPRWGTLPRGLRLLCHLLVPLSPLTKSYKPLELKAEQRKWSFLVQLKKNFHFPFFFFLNQIQWLTWSALRAVFISHSFSNKVKRISEYKAVSTLLQEADSREWWWLRCHQGQHFQEWGIMTRNNDCWLSVMCAG